MKQNSLKYVIVIILLSKNNILPYVDKPYDIAALINVISSPSHNKENDIKLIYFLFQNSIYFSYSLNNLFGLYFSVGSISDSHSPSKFNDTFETSSNSNYKFVNFGVSISKQEKPFFVEALFDIGYSYFDRKTKQKDIFEGDVWDSHLYGNPINSSLSLNLFLSNKSNSLKYGITPRYSIYYLPEFKIIRDKPFAGENSDKNFLASHIFFGPFFNYVLFGINLNFKIEYSKSLFYYSNFEKLKKSYFSFNYSIGLGYSFSIWDEK